MTAHAQRFVGGVQIGNAGLRPLGRRGGSQASTQLRRGRPSLDSICESFKLQYCNTCPDRSPRPSEWEYSDEWQQQEKLRHRDFMAKILDGEEPTAEIGVNH